MKSKSQGQEAGETGPGALEHQVPTERSAQTETRNSPRHQLTRAPKVSGAQAGWNPVGPQTQSPGVNGLLHQLGTASPASCRLARRTCPRASRDSHWDHQCAARRVQLERWPAGSPTLARSTVRASHRHRKGPGGQRTRLQ